MEKGSLVEVLHIDDTEGSFKAVRLPATIVKAVGENKYLVQFDFCSWIEADPEFEFQEVEISLIRPRPPELEVVDPFELDEEVDAMYMEAWCAGVVVQILPCPTHPTHPNGNTDRRYYIVFLKEIGMKEKFAHCQLRPHQDWIDGKWVKPL